MAVSYMWSSRAGAVHGSHQPAGGLERGSGAGPAFHLSESAPYPWPLRSYLELGALPTAVPCARLHARNLLWEWGTNELASTIELLVSELVTNAVKAVAGYQDRAAVRLRLSGDGTRVLVEVWDADPRPPAPKELGEDGTPDPEEEGGRGLFLVAALSTRWGWAPTQEPAGKLVWCELDPECSEDGGSAPRALLPRRVRGGQGTRSVETVSDTDVLRRVRDRLLARDTTARSAEKD
ncbi:MAG: ATP-binding protein [Streptosporangiaceae bacterium]